MATLILSTVGTIVGGPVGGSIGALIGQQIDQNILFKPKDREGPRLEDLSVQLSQYGRQVPRIYGRMRTAGTVIWATDLKETSERQGGGKGRPGTKVYTYSVSFAVALSSRPIEGVGRIWAEGNLLRGQAGDFKTTTAFRLHKGYGNQGADPLIASAEGMAGTPAHRGIAYAVFEDMDLTEYGNRIPSLTFEVIADTGEITLYQIMADQTRLSSSSQLPQRFEGFASSGGTLRAALKSIDDAVPISCRAADNGLDLREVMNPVQAHTYITASAIAMSDSDGEGALADLQESRSPSRTLPARLALRYYDPERDYQAGMRYARQADAQAQMDGRSSAIDLPAAMPSGAAQRVADNLYAFMRGGQRGLKMILSHVDEEIVPGATVQVEGVQGNWRVQRWQWRAQGIALDLVRQEGVTPGTMQNIQPGQIVSRPDLLIGGSILRILDLPAFAGQPAGLRNIHAAVSGETEAWRGASLYRAAPNGDLAETGIFASAPATMGKISNILGVASPLICDERSRIDVVLQHEGMHLRGASAEQLAQGANLALIGDEIIQFARAENIAPRTYRLSGLWRGRGGTEYAISAHTDEEDFTLLDESLVPLERAASPLGHLHTGAYAAIGPGDSDSVLADSAHSMRSLEPFAPVHLHAEWTDIDSLELSWVRRSRIGYDWNDYVDVPLGEESELYSVRIAGNDGTLYAEPESETPSMTIGPSIIVSARAAGATELAIGVRQKGQFATSPAANICMPLS